MKLYLVTIKGRKNKKMEIMKFLTLAIDESVASKNVKEEYDLSGLEIKEIHVTESHKLTYYLG